MCLSYKMSYRRQKQNQFRLKIIHFSLFHVIRFANLYVFHTYQRICDKCNTTMLHVEQVLFTLPEHTSQSYIRSRYCLPFRNTRISPTCGADTAYSFGTHELVPHVEEVLFYPSGTHELVPHVEQVLLILPEHSCQSHIWSRY